jgi:hypothetical protein
MRESYEAFMKRASRDAKEQCDLVEEPAHYAGLPIEPGKFILMNGLSFVAGNIVKYACRAGRKRYDGMSAVDSEITDLKKIQKYCQMRINQLRGDDVV